MEEHTEEAHLEEEAARLPVGHSPFPLRSCLDCVYSFQVKIAVYGSLTANFALCILQSRPSNDPWHNI